MLFGGFLKKKEEKALVYACSGCSNSGQMAHIFASRLDRAQWAEMGCLTGVAGNVPRLVEQVKSALRGGREVWVIDGCELQCGKCCLAQRDIEPHKALILTSYGCVKKKHSDVSPVEADRIFMEHVLPDLGLDEST